MNLKLQAIAKLINSQDIVIDVGTDHAYLPIYLKQNKLCKEVYASDVSPKALENAKQNIKKANLKITTYLTNGLKNINNQNINTIVIAGMGTLSILGILEDIPSNITKLIISSNNEHETLRKKLLKKKFYIEKEIVVKENNKYYPIMLLTRNYHKYTKDLPKYGSSYDKDYLNYLLNKKEEIKKKIPSKKILSHIKYAYEIKDLKKFIRKIGDYSE